ncbi:hypothetical protein Bbelb_244560 [Branchiostoma belcheri]|nr:hypothetical protein Bbelb_244560 [Branchiostoma belcheri]
MATKHTRNFTKTSSVWSRVVRDSVKSRPPSRNPNTTVTRAWPPVSNRRLHRHDTTFPLPGTDTEERFAISTENQEVTCRKERCPRLDDCSLVVKKRGVCCEQCKGRYSAVSHHLPFLFCRHLASFGPAGGRLDCQHCWTGWIDAPAPSGKAAAMINMPKMGKDVRCHAGTWMADKYEERRQDKALSQMYNSGDKWTSEQDPCTQYACQEGVVTVSQVQCYTPCSNPLTLPGQCCPVCKGCLFEGRTYPDGQTFTSQRDKCVTCTCQEGNVQCKKPVCPVLSCPETLAWTPPGECCPECRGQRKVFDLASGSCLFRSDLLDNGDAVKVDACTTCTCKESTMVCSKMTCPVKLDCDEYEPRGEGTCCPVCKAREPVEQYRTCETEGLTYQHGESFLDDACTMCTCTNGTVYCQIEVCDRSATCPEICDAVADFPEVGNVMTSGVHQKWREDGISHHHGSERVGALVQNTSEVSQHIHIESPGHTVTLDKVRILDTEQDYFVRGVKEAIYIRAHQPSLNRDAPGVCTVFGDPHYRSFDGKLFNFQGTCKYILSQDCKGEVYSVIVNNDARKTRRVHFKIKGVDVILGQHLAVRVNGKDVSLPHSQPDVLTVLLAGYLVKVITEIGIELTWDGDSFLEVSVPRMYRGKLCGLCGNFNGHGRDDFIGSDGLFRFNVNEFADSWRVGEESNCNRPSKNQIPSPCGNNVYMKLRAHKQCKLFRSRIFSRCSRLVKFDSYYRSCVTDMCECPSNRNCFCESVRAYTSECRRKGVEVDLSSLTACQGQELNPTLNREGGLRVDLSGTWDLAHPAPRTDNT